MSYDIKLSALKRQFTDFLHMPARIVLQTVQEVLTHFHSILTIYKWTRRLGNTVP